MPDRALGKPAPVGDSDLLGSGWPGLALPGRERGSSLLLTPSGIAPDRVMTPSPTSELLSVVAQTRPLISTCLETH